MKWCATRRDTHCLWSISKPLSGTYWSWGEPDKATSSHSLVSPCYSPPMLTLQLHTKWQVDITSSLWQMRFSTVVRDIYCLWSVSSRSLDTQGGCEVLLKASARRLWVSSCHFHWDPISNYTQNNTRFFLPYWYSKWDDVLQIEASIACEVFQNLHYSLDKHRRWYVLLTASIGYLWIT